MHNANNNNKINNLIAALSKHVTLEPVLGGLST